jgi:hypothetical protein
MLLVPLVALIIARAYMPGIPTVSAPASRASAPREPPSADDRTPEIRGRILDANGDPVEGAAVRLVLPIAPYAVLRDTKSGAGGSFSFAHVGPERVRVVADHDPDGAVSSAPVHAAEGRSIEVTLVLGAAGTVRGVVVDADEHPVQGATLTVEGAAWFVRRATSDEAGLFRLTTVPNEATSLVAVARGYKTARVALTRREDEAELVVRVQLVAAPPAEGDVSDADGKPVRARVVACEGQASEAHTVSAEDGTFTLPPSTIGCDVVAQHDEYAPSEAATVVEGRRIVLRLKAGGSIEGVVVDDRGASVPSFTIGIESFAAAQSRSFRSGGPRSFDDPRGAFRLEKLAPGSYVLAATAPGKPTARSDSIEVLGGAATSGVRIVLSPGGSVTGHVYDERHSPLAGVDLRFDMVSSVIDSSAEAKTDEAGQYRLDGAPAGPFTLRIHKDGFRLRLFSGLRVDSGRALTQDVTLTAVDGGAGMEFGGIGASLVQAPEGVAVSSVFTGAPAERAGLRAGDRVVRIDGEGTDGMSLSDAIQRLRGEEGTSVGVSVERPKTGETVDVMIVRAAIVR